MSFLPGLARSSAPRMTVAGILPPYGPRRSISIRIAVQEPLPAPGIAIQIPLLSIHAAFLCSRSYSRRCLSRWASRSSSQWGDRVTIGDPQSRQIRCGCSWTRCSGVSPPRTPNRMSSGVAASSSSAMRAHIARSGQSQQSATAWVTRSRAVAKNMSSATTAPSECRQRPPSRHRSVD